MRLIDPGPGELLDRETILELKIEAAEKRGLPIEHFLAERSSVLELLASAFGKSIIQDAITWKEWRDQLLHINQRVWIATDEHHKAVEQGSVDRCAHWGTEALLGNDERGALIHKINDACGVKNGQEKIR